MSVLIRHSNPCCLEGQGVLHGKSTRRFRFNYNSLTRCFITDLIRITNFIPEKKDNQLASRGDQPDDETRYDRVNLTRTINIHNILLLKAVKVLTKLLGNELMHSWFLGVIQICKQSVTTYAHSQFTWTVSRCTTSVCATKSK